MADNLDLIPTLPAPSGHFLLDNYIWAFGHGRPEGAELLARSPLGQPRRTSVPPCPQAGAPRRRCLHPTRLTMTVKRNAHEEDDLHDALVAYLIPLVEEGPPATDVVPSASWPETPVRGVHLRAFQGMRYRNDDSVGNEQEKSDDF